MHHHCSTAAVIKHPRHTTRMCRNEDEIIFGAKKKGRKNAARYGTDVPRRVEEPSAMSSSAFTFKSSHPHRDTERDTHSSDKKINPMGKIEITLKKEKHRFSVETAAAADTMCQRGTHTHAFTYPPTQKNHQSTIEPAAALRTRRERRWSPHASARWKPGQSLSGRVRRALPLLLLLLFSCVALSWVGQCVTLSSWTGL